MKVRFTGKAVRLCLALVATFMLTACIDKHADACTGSNSCNNFGPTGPSGGGENPDTGSKTPSFDSLGFRPIDTTIVLNTRYHVRGKVRVSTGQITDLLVHSSFGCSAYLTPVITSTTTVNWYDVDITVQGIATCRDSIVIRFKADTSVKTFVHVTVQSSSPVGPTITVTPPGGNGPKGTTVQGTCVITGLPDNRCRWYSTDPSRVDVVATDTNFVNFTNPWGTGAKKGGLHFFAFQGTANTCAYSVYDPKFAKCIAWTVIIPTSPYMASLFPGVQDSTPHDSRITPEMDEMYKVGQDRQKAIEMKLIK